MQEYIELEEQLHLLCQPLAKAAANLFPENENYSHTNLGLDALGKRILTRWITIDQQRICFALDLQNGSMQCLDSAFRRLKQHEIKDKTLQELEEALFQDVQELGYIGQKFETELKYTIEDYKISNKPFQAIDEKLVERWVAYRSMANNACQMVLLHVNLHDEVRIWPHHFDTGVYTEIDGKLGIGFGLTVKDRHQDFPYYYMSGYGLNKEIKMDHLPALNYGHWYTGKWKGAALPLHEIESKTTYEQWQALTSFILASCNWYLSATNNM